MSVLMSWARSTSANVEHTLGRTDHLFDRMLVGVLVLLAVRDRVRSSSPPDATEPASPARLRRLTA